MLRIAIAGALAALGAAFWTGDAVEAASADCRVYTASPNFVVGTVQTVPCTPEGLRVVNASPTVDQEVDLVEVGGVPIALGQTTMAASLPVVISSNQSAVPVTVSSGSLTVTGSLSRSTTGSATLSSANSAATSAQLLAANAGRQGVVIVNTDANGLYIKYGTTATTSIGGFSYLIPSGATFEMPEPVYTGRIDGIWAADGSGGASITEM